MFGMVVREDAVRQFLKPQKQDSLQFIQSDFQLAVIGF
jgi:hypothetical protein